MLDSKSKEDTRLLEAYFRAEYPEAILMVGKQLSQGLTNNIVFHYKNNEKAWKKDQERIKQYLDHCGLSGETTKGLRIFLKSKYLGYHFVLRDPEILKSFLNLAQAELELILLRPKITSLLLIGERERSLKGIKIAAIHKFFKHTFYDKNTFMLIIAFIFPMNEHKEKLLLEAIGSIKLNPKNLSKVP